MHRLFTNSTRLQWDVLLDLIEHNKDNDIVILWEGTGGDVASGERIYKKLGSIKKHITIRIVGQAISMHGSVLCLLHNLVEFKRGVIVLHNVFDGHDKQGKKRYDDKKTQQLHNECIRVGVLTRNEAARIIQNRERVEIYPNGQKVFKEDWK